MQATQGLSRFGALLAGSFTHPGLRPRRARNYRPPPMSALYQTLVAVHVSANLVWIGSILAVAVLLGSRVVESAVSAPLAHELYRRLAVPAFLVSFVAGAARLGLTPQLYLVETKYMHGKLLFALLVIALHHVIGARAKAVASGKKSGAGPVPALALGLLGCAVAATVLVVLKPF